MSCKHDLNILRDQYSTNVVRVHFDACFGNISCPPGWCAVVRMGFARRSVQTPTPPGTSWRGSARWYSRSMDEEISAPVQLMAECVLMHGRFNLSQEERSGESAAFHISTNGMRLAGVKEQKKGSYIIRSKLWETDELHFGSSYFAPFWTPACKRLHSPMFLERRKKSHLNVLMPLSGGGYDRRAEVVEMREPPSSNAGFKQDQGQVSKYRQNKIQFFFPLTHIIYGELVGGIKDHISLRDAKTNKPEWQDGR